MEQSDLNKCVTSTANIHDAFLATVRVKWVWIGLDVVFTADMKLKKRKVQAYYGIVLVFNDGNYH